MNSLIEYKCPNCGAIIEFDSESQSLKCPFCDSIFNLSDFSDMDANLSWDSDSEFSEYHCESCGAEIITDETTASMHCPYCNNPIILTDRLSGRLKPDCIIPFKLNKKAAISALDNHFKGKIFLPKVFKDQNHLDEIKGIYVPFWLYDTDSITDAEYEMKNTRMWTDTVNQYTETEIFRGHRSGISHFEKVPMDGSSKMPDDMMESLEPFDYKDIEKFKTAYLSGYYADKYDVDSEKCASRIKERVVTSAMSQLDSTIAGYDSVSKIKSNTSFSNTKIYYSLLPVWILNTNWNGNKYTFAMNGQTGKFVGNLPFDKWLVFKYYALYSILISGGLFILTRLFGIGM